MNVRERRLRADYQRIRGAFPNGAPISVRQVFGDPPEKYHVHYRVRGLVLQAGAVVEKGEHLVEVYLTQSYPRMAPQCRMLTPIFHPNIAPHAICIGDHWAAGESLSDLIARIGEMIAYQSYNTKSPLNGDAARWADLNHDKLPIDSTSLGALAVTPGSVGAGGVVAGAICDNCGATAGITACGAGHATCPNCRLECPLCRKHVCARCGFGACAQCGAQGCAVCVVACVNCGQKACAKDRRGCVVCGKAACTQCAVPCPVCEREVCVKDFVGDKGRCRRCAGDATARRVRVVCPGCQGTIAAPHRLIGKTIACPRCQAAVLVAERKPRTA